MATARWRRLTVMAVLAATLAGCGGSQASSSPGAAAPTAAEGNSTANGNEEAATPAEAIAAIGETRTLLEQAVDKLRGGDRGAAEEVVAEAYVERFEEVEGPLGERDGKLMQDLETLISTTIRTKIKGGASLTEVKELVTEAEQKLEQASKLLESS